MLLLWSCLTIWWRVALGDHQEGARATSVLHNNPPATFSVTFIWFSPGISDGTTPEKRKKLGVQDFTGNLNPPPSPMWVLRPPSSRHGRYEQLANRLRNSCFSASSFSRTAASAFQEAAASNSFPLLSFPFPPHMLSWPCAALKYTCSQYFW